MLNVVTTKIHADEDVVSALLNDEGEVDFNMILPFPGPFPVPENGVWIGNGAEQVWGTKWNADALCFCSDVTAGFVEFITAEACPIPVLLAVSKKFPTTTINVEYADNDIGYNCGQFTLLNGDFANKDIAPDCEVMSPDEREKWKHFAYGVRGWGPDPDEDDDAIKHAM